MTEDVDGGGVRGGVDDADVEHARGVHREEGLEPGLAAAREAGRDGAVDAPGGQVQRRQVEDHGVGAREADLEVVRARGEGDGGGGVAELRAAEDHRAAVEGDVHRGSVRGRVDEPQAGLGLADRAVVLEDERLDLVERVDREDGVGHAGLDREVGVDDHRVLGAGGGDLDVVGVGGELGVVGDAAEGEVTERDAAVHADVDGGGVGRRVDHADLGGFGGEGREGERSDRRPDEGVPRRSTHG